VRGGRGGEKIKEEGDFFYWGVVLSGTNASHFYRVGGRWRRRSPMRGHLYRSVPPTGTNVVICTGAKDTRYKSKNGPRYICVIL
jgi:hypothetical protein